MARLSTTGKFATIFKRTDCPGASERCYSSRVFFCPQTLGLTNFQKYCTLKLEKGFWPWLLPQTGRKFFFCFSHKEIQKSAIFETCRQCAPVSRLVFVLYPSIIPPFKKSPHHLPLVSLPITPLYSSP